MTINANADATQGFMYDLIAGVGQPIAENPTGEMMEAAFADLGLRWRYVLVEASASELPDIIAAMKALRFKGGNFTVPHKVSVIEHLDGLAESAELIGAVNTVRIENDGRWIGENTDGKGFMMAIEERGVDPKGKSIVILGAGGAARAIGVELVLAGAASITILNRSRKRGEDLVATLQKSGCKKTNLVEWDHTFAVPASTDILVQATSIGLGAPDDRPDIDSASIGRGMVVCDVIPNPPNTKFLLEAEENGAVTMDGLSMIVNQAATALQLWSGLEPNTKVMRDALEEGLGLR